MLSGDCFKISDSLDDLLYFAGDQAVPLIQVISAFADLAYLICIPDIATVDLDVALDAAIAV